MSFTPEELAEMARADAEIEREFILTAEEAVVRMLHIRKEDLMEGIYGR